MGIFWLFSAPSALPPALQELPAIAIITVITIAFPSSCHRLRGDFCNTLMRFHTASDQLLGFTLKPQYCSPSVLLLLPRAVAVLIL